VSSVLRWPILFRRKAAGKAPPEEPWRAAARAVEAAAPIAGAIVGPREFAALISGSLGYAETSALPFASIGCLVVHKGLMNEIAYELLSKALWAMRPIYANEVFVVLARNGPLLADPNHMASFYDNLAAAPAPAAAPAEPPSGRMAPVYLGDHTALTMTVDGLKLYVDTRDVTLAPHLLLDGMWEAWVTEAVKKFVKPGMRIADIGANVGYYSTLMGRIVGPGGWIHSFEPNPPIHELLCRSMEVNGFHAHSTCHRIALHSASGRRVLQVWRKHAGGSSFYSNAGDAAGYNDALDAVEVETARLDDVLGADPRLDLIKIDAEGAEPAIFEGARRVLAANRDLQIIMEFAPESHPGRGEPLLSSLRRDGFSIAVIEMDRRIEEIPPGSDDLLLKRPLSELYLRRS
jgi:FkbM family methyltransferase